MKVYLGPYPNDHVSIYRTFRGIEKRLGEDRFEKYFGPIQTLINFCWNDRFRRERKIKVKIHNYDTWNMDKTLCYIIVPLLKQLKETKHGAPFVDDIDVPKHLKSTSAKKLTKKQKDQGEVDGLHFKRWDYVLDEMIWAFEQDCIDWDSQYYSGESDFIWEAINPDEPNEEKQLYEMKTGPNHTFKVDKEGRDKHYERMKNGRLLFAKYYDGLWD